MSLERRLRQHFDTAGSTLSEPDADLDNVVKRGRRRVAVRNGAVAAGTLAVAAAAVLSLQGLSRTNVEFEPAAPPSSAVPTPEQTWGIATEVTPAPEATEPAGRVVETVSLADLGGPVIAYAGSTRDLKVYDEEGGLLIWSGRVDAALADGRGGVVVHVGKNLNWFPSADPRNTVTLVESDEPFELRTVLPDGRVVFSIFDSKRSEDMLERFYTVTVAENPTEQSLGDEFAFELWRVGPAAVADNRLVMAECHMVCTIYEWFPGAKESHGDELYFGGGGRQGAIAAIEGLTATRDGRIVGLVEGHTAEDAGPFKLVLLDGTSFEQLAVIPLPAGKQALGAPAAVSLSPNGQRVLISVRPSVARPGGYSSFLVEDALTTNPRIRRVEFDGVVRWLESQVDAS